MTEFVTDAEQLVIARDCVAGRSPSIQSVNSVVAEIARTDIPVLLTGESGTGKEVYARLIHDLSKNPKSPLIKISCRMREADEFFGELRVLLREGAKQDRGNSGTLFLDGIDELGAACQKALLSQLPDGAADNCEGDRFRRIATTTRNLDDEVDAGRFRPELYFRINGVGIRLPALRERCEDLPELLAHFLTKHSRQLARPTPALSEQEAEFLQSYDWPGNIRELENVARKMVLFGDTRIAVAELRLPRHGRRFLNDPQGCSLKVVARAASRQAERTMIKEALERTHWNRKQAAKNLGVSYKSLLYKIKETGLDGKAPDGE
jgi:two-component system response regulator AtoC